MKLVNRKIEQLTKEHEQNPELMSKVYQRRYQERLRTRLETSLAGLSDKNLKNTEEFLEASYQDAYIGANYSTIKEGYDLFLPYDNKRMEQAIYHSPSGFKISAKNYEGDVDALRKNLQSTLSRGLSSGMDYSTISRLAASKMKMGYNNMKRIIATEGHRVQNESKMDCMRDARACGADILKEWSSVMDNRTRTRHSVLDGQIRELEDPFTALGADVMYPGGFGIASEDIHCRCCLLQRARKVLSEDKIRQLESYKEFREKYREAKGKVGEFRTRNSPNAGNITAERAIVFKEGSRSPKKVRQSMKNTVIEIGGTGASCYDYDKDIMYIVEKTDRQGFIHEIGHVVDKKLINREKVDILLANITSDITYSDIEQQIFYDNEERPLMAWIIKNDKFISDYQGRIYVNHIQDAFDENGNIKTEYMLEYVSEGYREYIMHSDNLLKKDPELYLLIKEAVDD